jgi:outer membrane protein
MFSFASKSNMKNISLILNILLLLAVIFLYVDRFAIKGKQAAAPAISTGDAGSQLQVVHINLDTLHARSDEFQTKKAALEKRQADAEKSLSARAMAFEKEVIAFQQKMQSGTMTPKSAEDEQARLARKEQSIMEERERMAEGLLKETDDFNIKFTNQVKAYLDSLKTQMHYDYILVTGSGSPILQASDSLDITSNVLELLNKKKQ